MIPLWSARTRPPRPHPRPRSTRSAGASSRPSSPRSALGSQPTGSPAIRARTVGGRPLPSPTAHPQCLVVGSALFVDPTLRIPACRYLEVEDRLIPTGWAQAVQAKPLDFRQPHPIGDLHLDIAYDGLEPDA